MLSILDTSKIKWARQAIWALAAIKKENSYYFFSLQTMFRDRKDHRGMKITTSTTLEELA